VEGPPHFAFAFVVACSLPLPSPEGHAYRDPRRAVFARWGDFTRAESDLPLCFRVLDRWRDRGRENKSLKNPSKSACQAPRRRKIPITPTPSTTSLRKIAGILVMLRLIHLTYGSDPSRGSFDRAEINSRRPLAPLFLNRIRRTESIFYPQPPHGPSFWRSPRSRHSGEARISVLAFIAPLHFQEDRISRTESIFYPQLAANESFAASTRSKASFSPLTLMS